MGTAFGPVIDYLFAGTVQIAASPLFGQTLLTQLQAVDKNVTLTDNLYSAGENLGGDSVVLIGRNALDTAVASSQRVYIEVGQLNIEETFDVPIHVVSRGPGPQMKPIRDVALGHFNAVAHFLQQDVTMGGVLLKGRSAVLSDYQIDQTETETDTGALETCTITITITCRNYYQP